MKIVNRVEFLKLPSGALFREYEPCTFGELRVKGDTWPGTLRSNPSIRTDEFIVLHLDLVDADSSDEEFDILDRAQKTGESFRIDYDGWMRDGWSPEVEKQLFAVYEPSDVEQLIELLQRFHGKAAPTT